MLATNLPTPGVLNLANPANLQAPLNRGCLGWWLTLPNRVRNSEWKPIIGKDVGVMNNMDPVTDWAFTPVRPGGWGCFDTDGTNDYIEIPFTGFNNATNASLAVWIYKVSSASNSHTVGGNDGDADRFGMEWFGSTFYFTGRAAFPSVAKSVTGWHHVVLTYGTGSPTQVAYMDGVNMNLTGGTDSGPLNSGVDVLRLGRNAATSGVYGTGRHDDLRAYNRTLSATEARQLYWASRGGYQNELNWIRRPMPFKPAAAGLPVSNSMRGGFVNMCGGFVN